MSNGSKTTRLTEAEYIASADLLGTSQNIQQIIENAVEALGVVHFSYHHFPAVGAFDFSKMNRYHAHNIPSPVLEFYDDNSRISDDPGMVRAFSTGQFFWLSDMAVDELIPEEDHKERLKSLLDYIGDGLIIPLYGPSNRRGYVFAGYKQSKEDVPAIFAYQIQSLCQIMHVKYCMMISSLRRQVNLTNRETEVLELVTFGKSNAEIGQILDISVHTVSGYVKRLFLKLDVNDRVSLAMRARTLVVRP